MPRLLPLLLSFILQCPRFFLYSLVLYSTLRPLYLHILLNTTNAIKIPIFLQSILYKRLKFTERTTRPWPLLTPRDRPGRTIADHPHKLHQPVPILIPYCPRRGIAGHL